MIAEIAAGAGHELNSPLTVISGRAQMLAKAAADPEVQRSLELIRTKAHECSRIVSELMDFARPHPPRPAPIDLPALLAELRTTWLERSSLAPSRVQIEPAPRTGQAEPLQVQADPEQFRTVLNELIANACDAVAENDGRITLSCQALPAENLVEIIVRDTGCGMTPSVLQRAFDPFFSHRPAGRGRGLGLARAYRIVESHGGRIWLESAPHEGTTAHVVLPLKVRS
jgi:signal transduction histidine kinase